MGKKSVKLSMEMDLNKIEFSTVEDGCVVGKLKCSFMADREFMEQIFGPGFAAMAFSSDKDEGGTPLYKSLKPSVQFASHRISFGKFDPSTSTPAFETVEPHFDEEANEWMVKVSWSMARYFRNEDEGPIVLSLVQSLGKGINVSLEPLQQELDFDGTDDDTTVQLGDGEPMPIDEFMARSQRLIADTRRKRS